MLRILIADDHKIVRNGLKSIFNGQPDMAVTGEAGDGQIALDMLSKKIHMTCFYWTFQCQGKTG
jgi:YesN/AraC family two-component response regulator